jgi:hypothetical protein
VIFKGKWSKTNRMGKEVAAFYFFFWQNGCDCFEELRARIDKVFECEREGAVIDLFDAADFFDFTLGIFLRTDERADLHRARIALCRVHDTRIGPDHIICRQLTAIVEIDVVKQLISEGFTVIAGFNQFSQIKSRRVFG